MSRQAMLAEARRWLGVHGRPNPITRAYASRNGSEYLFAPWCDQSVTEWAHRSGNPEAVLPAGDRAYTVWHADDGRKLGRWHAGTVGNIKAHARPGCIVFFDWGGSNVIGAIDHVGVVERVLPDGRVQTIEANTGDAVRRRVRSAAVIAGFWDPDYEGQDDVSAEDVWKAKIKPPYAKPDKPEWRADTVLTNHGVWLRRISAQLDAQAATIRTLVEALAARDGAIDADALVQRIKAAIEGVSVRLDVPDDAPPTPPLNS